VKADKKKRPPIRKATPKTARKNRQEQKITKEDRIMYAEIWEERPHVDFETGEPIMSPSTLNFHHVLPKKESEYPEFRHCKWNVILVNWETHTKAEANAWKLIPKIKAYRDHLLKTYVNV